MPDDWRSIADEKIHAAIAEGKFDNLQGAGEPFDWEDENPYEDSSMQTAHDLLKANGFTLPWIEEKHSIEAEAAYQVEALKRALLNYQRMDLELSWWDTRVDQFKREMLELNRRILTLNIKVPDASFQMRTYDVTEMLESVQTTRND